MPFPFCFFCVFSWLSRFLIAEQASCSQPRRFLSINKMQQMNTASEPAGTPVVTDANRRVPVVYRCFLFTDIEGSTALWERYGERFRETLDLHHAIIRETLGQHGGRELVEAGDGFLVCFEDPRAAARCAAAAQEALSRARWPLIGEPLKIRMGLHAGDVEPREDGEYRGVVLNRAARVRDTAHGGQIVCSEAVCNSLEASFSFRDLGRFRLKGLPVPERLYQVQWDGMPASFPPPNAIPAYTHNLPRHQTRFVGRKRQMQEVAGLISSGSGGRLVTLTGPGGTGKTRLAQAVAGSLLEHFSHAVFFIPLADVEDAALIPREIAEALRLDAEAGINPEDQIVAFIGNEPALLVLDNFERLAAGGADVLQRLLGTMPRLCCLVTSRNRIDLLGEREYPVPPLSTPAQGMNVAELQEVESVQLFVDRAHNAHASFALHEGNAVAVGELCTRLDGVPLALELAAARSDVLSPREILESLGSRLDSLIATDAASAPARHRTLRAAIDWSFEFLPPALREFFANLSVFRGGWTAPAADAVAGSSALGDVSANVVRALSELRSASLIVTQESGDSMRFRMLETLRHYAEEKFSTNPDAEAIVLRHRLFYLALAEEAEAKLQGAEQGAWMERLEVEHDNLRALLNDTYPDATGLRVAGALAQFWLARGHFDEGRELIEKQLGRDVEATPIIRMSAVNGAGMLAWVAGDMGAARRHFERALSISREVNDPRNVAGMLNNLGIVAMRQSDFESAERFMQEALQIYTELGTLEHQRAKLLMNLAIAANERREFRRAKEHTELATRILEPIGDVMSLRAAYNILGRAEAGSGNVARGRELSQRAITMAAQASDLMGVTTAIDGLSETEYDAGEAEEALRLMSTADYLAERLSIRDWETTGSRLARLAVLRSTLDPARFAKIWAEGRDLGRSFEARARHNGKR